MYNKKFGTRCKIIFRGEKVVQSRIELETFCALEECKTEIITTRPLDLSSRLVFEIDDSDVGE